MANKSKPIEITILVGNSIWLLVSVVLFGVGLGVFIYQINNELAWYWAWLIFGAFCVIPCIRYIWIAVVTQTKKGYIEGANDYTTTVTVSSTSVSARTQNHPIRGAIIGFLGGILGGLIAGPVATLFIIITYITKVIKQAKVVSRLFPKKGKVQRGVARKTPNVIPFKGCKVTESQEVEETKVSITKGDDLDTILETTVLSLFSKEMNALDKRFSLEYEDDFNGTHDNLNLTHYQIIKDSLSLKTILRLGMKNTSIAKIKAVHLEITALDNSGARLGYIKNIVYGDHLIDIGEETNADMGIVLPKGCTNGLITITKIVFEDGLALEEISSNYPFLTLDKVNADMDLYMKVHEVK